MSHLLNGRRNFGAEASSAQPMEVDAIKGKGEYKGGKGKKGKDETGKGTM